MSVPTVAGLCASLGQHLQPAEGFEAPPTPVTAVHISELLDPSSYVTGGELLLTTGLALPANKIGCDRYVGRLAGIGIAALGYGLGPVHQTVPDHLVRACRKHQMPLLVVPVPTPFLTITKAYWTARARSTEQSLQDAVATHRALIDAAVAPDPSAEMLRRLSRALGGWAASITPGGDVEQIHPAGLVDEAEALQSEVARLEVAGVNSAASFATRDRYVAVYPLPVEGRVVGYLAVGTPSQLRPEQRQVVLTAVALLSIDALRRQRSTSAREATARCVAVLVDQGLVDAARRLASAMNLPALGQECRVLLVRGRDSEDLSHVVESWCPDVYANRVTRHDAWFVLPAAHPPMADLVTDLAARDEGACAVVSALVSVADVGPVRARLAAQMSSSPAGRLDLVDSDSWADHDLAGRLDDFVEHQPATVVDALVGYLRRRGQWELASRDLGMHRNTLRHRVGRAREALGLDIDDPDVAARLWLLLRSSGRA